MIIQPLDLTMIAFLKAPFAVVTQLLLLVRLLADTCYTLPILVDTCYTVSIKVTLDVFQIDDQVLLLQNAWAELISLGAIWRSRFSFGVINLSFGKTLDLQKAREMEHEEVLFKLQLSEIAGITLLNAYHGYIHLLIIVKFAV